MVGIQNPLDFFHNTGLQYVSCSPYRVPIARLAAAQAKINNILLFYKNSISLFRTFNSYICVFLYSS